MSPHGGFFQKPKLEIDKNCGLVTIQVPEFRLA